MTRATESGGFGASNNSGLRMRPVDANAVSHRPLYVGGTPVGGECHAHGELADSRRSRPRTGSPFPIWSHIRFAAQVTYPPLCPIGES